MSLVFEKHLVFGQGRNLGAHYNETMRNAKTPWVLLLDHDVLLGVSKHWFSAACGAIEWADDKKVGLIVCRGRCHMGFQLCHGAPGVEDSILKHIRFAKKLWKKEGPMVEIIPPPVSGFFFLVRKQCWKEVGGFVEGKFEQTDYAFSKAIHRAGWQIALLKGLYCAHVWKEVKQTKLWRDW